MKVMSKPATGPFLVLQSEDEGKAALEVVRSMPPKTSPLDQGPDISVMKALIKKQMAANASK